MDCALVWFRRDLRLADNPSLSDALISARRVVPVFVAPHAGASDGPGEASLGWLSRSLASLGLELRARGSALVTRTGPAPQALVLLAEQTGARVVCCQRDWTPRGIAEEHAAQAVLRERGLELRVSEGQLLVEPPSLVTGSGGGYSVFTPFWRAWRAAWEPTAPLPAPRSLPSPAAMPPSEPLGLPNGPGRAASTGREPGEQAAAARLSQFCEHDLGRYDELRDTPGLRATSELSPHLAWGEVSANSVARAALETGGESAEPFLRQLAWREFSYHVLHHHPTLGSEPLRAEFSAFPWSSNDTDLDAWKRGATGYPLVDAGMRQLAETGWMHNRVRLVAASFLVKDLLVAWQDGEEHFRQALLDYDDAANAFNWQWVAGCGADAAPYFRVFNPTLQGVRFDGGGDYVRRWVPELARLDTRWIHRPWDAPSDALEAAGVVLGESYPHRLVDHAEARKRALAAYASVRTAK